MKNCRDFCVLHVELGGGVLWALQRPCGDSLFLRIDSDLGANRSVTWLVDGHMSFRHGISADMCIAKHKSKNIDDELFVTQDEGFLVYIVSYMSQACRQRVWLL